jgi:hypothetical protein
MNENPISVVIEYPRELAINEMTFFVGHSEWTLSGTTNVDQNRRDDPIRSDQFSVEPTKLTGFLGWAIGHLLTAETAFRIHVRNP